MVRHVLGFGEDICDYRLVLSLNILRGLNRTDNAKETMQRDAMRCDRRDANSARLGPLMSGERKWTPIKHVRSRFEEVAMFQTTYIGQDHI